MERHDHIVQEALNWIGVLILITAMIFAFACISTSAQDAPPDAAQQAPPDATQQQAPPDSTQQAQAPQPPQQQPQQPQPATQPPAQADNQNGVARASFIHGDVAMQRGDSGEWSAVTLNTPLMAGDKISTGDDARTEVELDFADILRLDNKSQANLATLASNRIQVQVAQGVANYSVLKGAQADAEIDTPNVAVHPLEPGRYTVRILADGDSEITVREGQADVSTSQGNTTVQKGQLITVHGMGADAQYKISDASASDDFDSWNKDRDDIIYNAHAYQHMDHYYTGGSDLDAYGTWNEVPDYGPVWVPNEPAGWAPYRAGSWVWEPYWGWTWASYEPWGWAPYHYGRWFLYGNSWAWWPGPFFGAYRPIWAPAYVGFFGFGRGFGFGFGLGFGFGSIGWLPIGPGDFFHPWWGGFRDSFGAVDLTHMVGARDGIAPLHAGTRFSNLNEMLANNRMRAGISSVAAGSFGRGAVNSHEVGAADLRGARMMTGNVPVAPTRDSLRTSNRAVGSDAARASTQQHFFSNHAPAARSESFSEEASHVQQSMQRGGQARAAAGGAANGNSNAGFANRAGAAGGSSPSYRPQAQGGAAQASQGQGRAPNLEGQGSDVWHSFNSGTSRSASSSRAGAQPSYRPAQSSGSQGASRTFEAQGQSQGGWQRFTPQSRSESSPSASRGYSGGQSGGYRSNYRPPLDMSKPVVTPRSYSGARYGAPYSGSGERGGSSSNYRPSYSAPSGGSYRGSTSSRGGSSRSSGHGGGHGGGHR